MAKSFGFNGKEQDPEAKGTGVQYDYGFRIYDARIARFLNVDPLTKKYPYLTPFQFASNRPICAIDLDGLEAEDKSGNIAPWALDSKVLSTGYILKYNQEHDLYFQCKSNCKRI